MPRTKQTASRFTRDWAGKCKKNRTGQKCTSETSFFVGLSARRTRSANPSLERNGKRTGECAAQSFIGPQSRVQCSDAPDAHIRLVYDGDAPSLEGPRRDIVLVGLGAAVLGEQACFGSGSGLRLGLGLRSGLGLGLRMELGLGIGLRLRFRLG